MIVLYGIAKSPERLCKVTTAAVSMYDLHSTREEMITLIVSLQCRCEPR